MKRLFFLLLILGVGAGIYWKFKQVPRPNEELTRKEIPLLKKPDDLFVRHIDESPKEINTLQDKARQKSLHEGVAAWVGVYRLELAAYPVNNKVRLGLYINNSIGQLITPKRTTLYLQEVVDGVKGDKLKPLRSSGNGLFMTMESKPTSLPQKYLITGELAGKKFSVTFNITNYRSHIINPE